MLLYLIFKLLKKKKKKIFKLTSENQIDFHETVARCSLSYHLVCRVATWGGLVGLMANLSSTQIKKQSTRVEFMLVGLDLGWLC